METQTSSSQLRWSSKGLLDLLRASLPPAGTGPAPVREPRPAVERLNSRQLAELADAWRHRTAEGDKGAESVAQALELLASRRAGERRSRIQAMGQRISDLMQLS
ncbi:MULTISPECIES: hypothetical protein [unclassified Variovorax]|uniref:hypothetical protein n=1 Tax=unclassified Variovorax TaxID=663243 RepID=UPI0013A5961B|nr:MULTISPECIES: hypothetical protein [unclassified Variovorax]